MSGYRAEKSGFAAESYNKIQSKYDQNLAQELLIWIKEVTGQDMSTAGDAENFQETLKTGVTLCNLINALQPGTIIEKKIHQSKLAFKCMENINTFLDGCAKLGVVKEETFQTVDLWEGINLPAVCICIFSLARKGEKFGQRSLGPKESEKNERMFSEQQLNAGAGIIGLQSGSNKGANQSGINMGNTRHM